ncbi:MAG: FtsX-like permease family protein [Dehalococcoidia bacterium]|nr:FtsX-like permease family protein [Dehalococcoidia bacterium]
MRTAFTVLRLVLRRSRANWRLLSTVVVGVVLSSALLASVAIYSDAVRDLGLSYALEEEPDQQLDVRVLNSSHRFSPSLYDERAEALDTTLDAQAGDVFSDVVHYGKSDTFFPAPVGESPDSDDEDRPRAHFQFIEELQDQTELVAGEWPGEPGETDGMPHLEVLLGAAAAEQHGLEVGDTFDIHPFWVQEPRPVRVTISGLLEPQDPQARHWYDVEDRFIEEGTRWPTYPFWVDQEVLTGTLASYLPAMGGNFETYGIVDRAFINSSNAEGIANRLSTMDRLLKERIPRTTVDTTLPETLETYQDKLFFTRLPLFALMLQVAGIVLFYLVMVSTMLVDRQTGEIALLRSRGASPRQVMGIYAVEGGLLALGATIVGPLLAALAISMLGRDSGLQRPERRRTHGRAVLELGSRAGGARRADGAGGTALPGVADDAAEHGRLPAGPGAATAAAGLPALLPGPGRGRRGGVRVLPAAGARVAGDGPAVRGATGGPVAAGGADPVHADGCAGVPAALPGAAGLRIVAGPRATGRYDPAGAMAHGALAGLVQPAHPAAVAGYGSGRIRGQLPGNAGAQLR